MPALPLAKGYYKRADNVVTRLVNMMFEANPTNQTDQVSLISRFGLEGDTFDSLSAGPIRGACRHEGSDYAWVVSGTRLYKVQDNGTATLIGTGNEITGTARVRMATNGTNVMIAAGTSGAEVLKTSDGSSISTVTTPDSIGITDVVCIGGVFVFLKANSQRVYFSEAYAVTIDPLNYFSAELTPDILVALVANGDEMHLIGRTTTEVWVPYADADLPFQRVEGRLASGGCAGRHTAVLVGDAACWVGDDNKVYRRGEAFSGNDLSAIIKAARPGLSDWSINGCLNAWSYPFLNHELYCLDVPGAGTFAFDFSTAQWFELSSYGLGKFRVGCAVKMADGVWMGGDSYNGTLWKLDDEVRADGDDPLVRIFPGLIESTATIPNSNVTLDCTVGQASLTHPTDAPTIQLRYSDDRGKTFSDWLDASLGHQGDYDVFPEWRRLGSIRPPGRLYEFRFADALPLTVRKAAINERWN